MNDFSSPRRMSAGALIILFQKSLKEIAGATFVAIGYVVYDSFGSSLGEAALNLLITIGVIFALSLLVAFLSYYFRKFHIEGDKLVYTHGFAAKQTMSIPLSRVHTLRTKKGLFYRLLDMRGVTFDTLASEQEEVELILDEKDWQMLLNRIRMGEDFSGITDSTVTLPPPMEDSSKKVSNFNIIKGALCQNHLKGFTVLAAVAIAVSDKLSQLDEDTTYRILSYLDDSVGDALPSVGGILLFLAILYLIVMLLWTGKIFLRYSGMSIRIADNRLTIESGLISRYTCRVAREKTTMLTIKRNPLEKLAHCETIALHQADNVTNTKREGNIRIYGSNLGNELFRWWLGDSGASNCNPLMAAKSGKGLFMRKFIPHFLLAFIISLIIICTEQIVMPTVIIGSAYVAIMAVRALMAWKHSGIELYDNYIKINRGNIATIREYVKYEDIESVSIRTSPFTKYSGRVSLKITTNAGSSSVYSLNFTEAIDLRNILFNKVYQ